MKGQAVTGIDGLDQILQGGLPRNSLYLVEGDPGSGKTTLALRFLVQGAEQGERCLYVTLSESKTELEGVAKSHGMSLAGLEIFELIPDEPKTIGGDEQYTFFHPSEVELGETTKAVLEVVNRVKPSRVVFDSLSEMRLLARDPLRYRRQILGLKQFFAGKDCTVLLLDDKSSTSNDLQMQSLAHGVIVLEQLAPEYGAERRRLRVVKLRGSKYRGGYHDFVIATGGLTVFPRLVASEHSTEFEEEATPSGVESLDKIMGGGMPRGSSTLLIGPAGVGKSSVATQYAVAAMKRGEKAAMFTFEEGMGSLFARSRGLKCDLTEFIEKGLLYVRQIDPAELSPGEFANLLQSAVEDSGAKFIIIDSLNGYLNAMPEERFLIIQLHEILSYLSQLGVTTIIVCAQHGLMGTAVQAPVDTSYLADNIILFRFYEMHGEVHKALSVVKKRSGCHETSIRELTMGGHGLSLGEPLVNMRGILTGVPELLESACHQ